MKRYFPWLVSVALGLAFLGFGLSVDGNAFLVSLAAILSAIAWPLIVVILLFRHESKVGDVIDRVREAFGFKLAPPARQAAPAVEPQVPAEIVRLRTSEVMAAENVINNFPPLRGVTDPNERAATLLTISARFLVNWRFQNVDASIWKSQLDLLQHLLAAGDRGEDLDTLKSLFYEPAAKLLPDWFTNYPFEEYLAFLAKQLLLSVGDGRARITPFGTEYLQWRVLQRQPAKMLG
jgi:hypothetical protein